MKRVVYLDWLRVIATIAVITIHVSASVVTMNLYDHHQSFWLAGNLFESLSRFTVPMFVMISGALLLSSSKDIEYKQFLWKRVNKVFIPLIGWSIIYFIYWWYFRGAFDFSIKTFIKAFLKNGISYHLWFLYMIVGLYLITPLVKIFVKHASRKDIQYFLLLWFYASIIVKWMNHSFGYSFNVELYYVSNYVGYFILGYYLANYEITPRWRKLAYIGGLLGVFATFALTYYYTRKAGGQLDEYWYEYFSPNVLLVSIGLFIFGKYNISRRKERLSPIGNIINETSFGIYLVHMLILVIFEHNLFQTIGNAMHPIFSIPCRVIITLIISTMIAWVLKKTPFLNKLVP